VAAYRGLVLLFVGPAEWGSFAADPFFSTGAARTAAALFAALWSSPARPPPTRPSGKRQAAVAADVNIERVVLQAYRAIGDRHLYEPNFRAISAEAIPGFAGADPALALATSDAAFTVKRDRPGCADPPAPADSADGRAWGGMLAELMAGSMEASLSAADRPPGPDPRRLDGHHKQLDRKHPLRRIRGGARQPLSARTAVRHRHHRRAYRHKKILIAAVRTARRRPRPACRPATRSCDRRRIDDRPHAGRCRVAPARLGRRAGHAHRAASDAGLRAGAHHEACGASYQPLSPTSGAAMWPDPSHGLNSARPTICTPPWTRRAPTSARTWPASSSTCAPTGGLLARRRRSRSCSSTTAPSSRPRAAIPTAPYLQDQRPQGRRHAIVVLITAVPRRRRDRGGGASGSRRALIVAPRATARARANRGATVQRRRADPDWSRLHAIRLHLERIGRAANICTSKVADADQLGPNSLDSSQGTLMRWHALRNPTHQEVTDLRRSARRRQQPRERCRRCHPPAARPQPLCPCRAGRDPAGRQQ